MSTEIDIRLSELGLLKDLMNDTKKAAEDAEAAYRQFEWDTVQLMRERGVPSVRLDGDGLYVRRATTFAHVTDQDAFDEWLKETDQTDEFHERPKARKKLLNELVRDLLERGVPEDQWPPGLGSYTREYISRQKG